MTRTSNSKSVVANAKRDAISASVQNAITECGSFANFLRYVLTLSDQTDENARALIATLCRVSTSDDGKILTVKLPFATSCTIERKLDGKFYRSAFDVQSFDMNGKRVAYTSSPTKDKSTGIAVGYPTLDKALNAFSVAYGRQALNVILNSTRDASIKTTRSNAEIVEARKQAEEAQAALAERDAKIAELEEKLNRVLAQVDAT